MSILTLLNDLNISEEDLKNISSSHIIRIEKQLKAEAKFDDSIDINAVEETISVLKNNQTELIHFFSEDLSKLRLILTRNGFYQIFSPPKFSITSTPEFFDFFNSHFHEKIKEYVLICISESHYNALNSCTYYHVYFDHDLMDDLSNQLLKKIEFATESIRIHAHNIHDKINFLSNPYLYRCLNNLGSIQFEAAMIDLFNVVNSVLNESLFYSKIVFSQSFFNSSSKNFDDILKNNKKWAIDQGVSEITYDSNSKHTNGGTKLINEPDIFNFPLNQPKTEAQLEIERQEEIEEQFINELSDGDENESSSEPVNKKTKALSEQWYSDENIPENITKSSTRLLFKIIVITLLLFAAYTVFFSKKETRQEQTANRIVNRLFEDINSPKKINPTPLTPFQYKFKTYKEAQQYFKNLTIKPLLIVSSMILTAREVNINYQSPFLNKENHQLSLKNITPQPILIIIFDIYNDIRFRYIDANTNASIYAKPSSILIYTGKEPQGINYINEQNLNTSTFRFNTFTNDDYLILDTLYDFKDALFLDNKTTEFIISPLHKGELKITKQ
jgi:hypothetical protein